MLLRARYRRHRAIGSDESSRLYRGWDTKLVRSVSIKLFPRVGSDARGLERAARLSHQSVVPVHEVDLDHDPPFVVMGAIEGVSLRSWVEAHGPTRPGWLGSIAEYLRLAHSHGLAHHDLLPSMLFITAGAAQLVGSGRPLDAKGVRADVHGLGVLGFYALTATMPGVDPAGVMREAGVANRLASTIGSALGDPLMSMDELSAALSASRGGGGA